MESNEIIKKLEELIHAEKARLDENKKKETASEASETEESLKEDENKPSLWQQIVDVVTAPFRYMAKFLTGEFSHAIRADIKRFETHVRLSILLYIAVISLWISIQFFLVLCFIYMGASTFLALGISIGIQLISLLIIVYLIHKNSKKSDTMELIERLKNSK